MQNTPESFNNTLVGYGLEVGLLVSGFFGALMMVGRKSAQRVSTTLISVIAGTACANFLTPVVLHIAPAPISDGRGKFAAAFVMGFLGLKGLEMVVEKWFGDSASPSLKNKKRKPRRKKDAP